MACRDAVQVTACGARVCCRRNGCLTGGNDRMGFVESQHSEVRDHAFVGRMYRMRMLGLGLSALSVAAVLYENGASHLAWGLLLLNLMVWPHVAWWRARRSPLPREAEFRNLVLDSTFGGAWVAMMQFNLLPSVLLM